MSLQIPVIPAQPEKLASAVKPAQASSSSQSFGGEMAQAMSRSEKAVSGRANGESAHGEARADRSVGNAAKKGQAPGQRENEKGNQPDDAVYAMLASAGMMIPAKATENHAVQSEEAHAANAQSTVDAVSSEHTDLLENYLAGNAQLDGDGTEVQGIPQKEAELFTMIPSVDVGLAQAAENSEIRPNEGADLPLVGGAQQQPEGVWENDVAPRMMVETVDPIETAEPESGIHVILPEPAVDVEAVQNSDRSDVEREASAANASGPENTGLFYSKEETDVDTVRIYQENPVENQNVTVTPQAVANDVVTADLGGVENAGLAVTPTLTDVLPSGEGNTEIAPEIISEPASLVEEASIGFEAKDSAPSMGTPPQAAVGSEAEVKPLNMEAPLTTETTEAAPPLDGEVDQSALVPERSEVALRQPEAVEVSSEMAFTQAQASAVANVEEQSDIIPAQTKADMAVEPEIAAADGDSVEALKETPEADRLAVGITEKASAPNAATQQEAALEAVNTLAETAAPEMVQPAKRQAQPEGAQETRFDILEGSAPTDGTDAREALPVAGEAGMDVRDAMTEPNAAARTPKSQEPAVPQTTSFLENIDPAEALDQTTVNTEAVSETEQSSAPSTPKTSGESLSPAQSAAKPAEHVAEAPGDANPVPLTAAPMTAPFAQEAPAEAKAPLPPIEQIALEATLSQGIGKNHFVMRLNPEALGEVTVRMTLGAQGVIARITVTNEEARSAIAQQLHQLGEAMREKGIDVRTIELSRDYTGAGTMLHDGNRGSAGQNSPPPRWKYSRARPQAEAIAAMESYDQTLITQISVADTQTVNFEA